MKLTIEILKSELQLFFFLLDNGVIDQDVCDRNTDRIMRELEIICGGAA